MKGFVTLFIMFMFVLVVIGVVGVPALEGVGEGVKDTGMLDSQYEDIIDNIYQAVFVRVPLITIFGMFIFGVVWYFRRQQTTA